MRQTILGIAASLLLTLASAGAAAAQVVGLPVYNSGIPTGLGLYGDVGFPNDRAGGGTAFGGMGRLGLGPFGITAAVGYLNPEGPGDKVTGVGGTLNYKFFGGPLVPLTATLQGGAGYAKVGTTIAGEDIKEYRFPIGVGFALTIPNPLVAIKPWLAPRVDIARRTVGDVSDTETGFGLSGGIEVNFLSGIGLHAAYDRVFRDADDPGVFAAGLHYNLRIPGL